MNPWQAALAAALVLTSPKPLPSRPLQPGAGSEALQRHFERWAVHALVEPLVEGEAPPAWRDLPPLLYCDVGTAVRIDGAPLRAGTTLPREPVRIAWHAKGCRPFGPDGVELHGDVELTLFVEVASWTARVEPRGLRLVGVNGEQAELWRPFSASMPVSAPLAGDRTSTPPIPPAGRPALQ